VAFRLRRNLSVEAQEQWNELMDVLRPVALLTDPNIMCWALEVSSVFYISNSTRGASVAHAKDIWKLSTSLKLKIFLWQLARVRLPASEQIKKRHEPSDGRCVLCAQPEDVAHIFFNYPLAQFMWSGLGTMFDVSWNHMCFANVFSIFQRINGKTRRLLWTVFAT
jgi:hypothetical protein